MILEALLDELRGNVLRDDSELASGPDDQLWSDDTLVRYINDAQSKFARRTLSLRDASTPAVVEVTLTAGVATYVLHNSVLAVVSAYYDTDTTDLARAGHALVWVQQTQQSPPWFDPSLIGTWAPGRPLAFATDETLDVDTRGSVKLTVYPTPTSTEEGKIVHLRTARLPIAAFTVDDMTVECELDPDYQLDMLEWAAYRALNNSDIDGHKSSAADHEAAFEKAIRMALKDMRQKMRVPLRFNFNPGFRWS